jgi:hypothetical protein
MSHTRTCCQYVHGFRRRTAYSCNGPEYDCVGRTGRRHRQQILKHLGIRRMAAADKRDLTAWLVWDVCPNGVSAEEAIEQAYGWCRDRGVLSPVAKEFDRLVRSARRDFETDLLERVAANLAPGTVSYMEASLASSGSDGFDGLKADPGPVSLESVLTTAESLAFIRALQLPAWIAGCAGAPLLTELRRRVAHETGWEMRRHPTAQRPGLPRRDRRLPSHQPPPCRSVLPRDRLPLVPACRHRHRQPANPQRPASLPHSVVTHPTSPPVDRTLSSRRRPRTAPHPRRLHPHQVRRCCLWFIKAVAKIPATRSLGRVTARSHRQNTLIGTNREQLGAQCLINLSIPQASAGRLWMFLAPKKLCSPFRSRHH